MAMRSMLGPWSWFILPFVFFFFPCKSFVFMGNNVSLEIGFFPPAANTRQNYYVGIWYNKDSAVQSAVWMANRNKPLTNPSSSTMKLIEDGSLFQIYHRYQITTPVWCTNSSSESRDSIEAVLLDNGNLVEKNASDSSAAIWLNFDYWTNTWVPYSKDDSNKIGNNSHGLSWENSGGLFSLHLDIGNPSQNSHFVVRTNGSQTVWASGMQDLERSRPTVKGFNYGKNLNFDYTFGYVRTSDYWRYFSYTVRDNTSINHLVAKIAGQTSLDAIVERNLFWPRPSRYTCEDDGSCVAFAICDRISIPRCQCLHGFEPKYSRDWESGNFSGACVRKHPLQCNAGRRDSFLMLPNILLPESHRNVTVGSSEECESACLNNCSCTAYSYYGRSCLVWTGDLLNIQKLSNNNGSAEDLHLRLATSELMNSRSLATKGIIMIIVAVIGILIGLVFIWRCKRRMFIGSVETDENLYSFKYRDLKIATKKFSEELGKGGFGTVFKGTLPNSTAIAVKKLQYYTNDEKQFRAEVNTIGLIHHINLIRLRGFCAEGTKRLLVYEYMPNGSLSSYLFGKVSKILDWKARYQIALGIARGLAYLHEKCRQCIIHCDIKPDNILLDVELSPKIADFGLAKLLGRDFSRVLTTMRGTRGYLAPEWLSGSPITPKADVYSYGKMLFEIISGKRNFNTTDDDMVDYFPALAASKINKQEDILSLLDCRLEGNADVEELTRVCKVACWCIQDDEKDRPSIGHIVNVLEGISEVDTPPMPSLLQIFVCNPMENKAYWLSSCN